MSSETLQIKNKYNHDIEKICDTNNVYKQQLIDTAQAFEELLEKYQL